MVDPLFFPIYPRPTTKYRRKFFAKRRALTILGAKSRISLVAAEYAAIKGDAFAEVLIRDLFRSLEAVRKSGNGTRQRGDGGRERYLAAAYWLCSTWRDNGSSLRITEQAAKLYGIPMQDEPIKVIIQATAPFRTTFTERKLMVEVLLHAQDNYVSRDQLAAFLEGSIEPKSV